MEVAKHKLDAALCERSSPTASAEFYMQVAMEDDDTTVCSSIKDEMDRDKCIIEVNKYRE
jgi:hypothetical protein